MLSENLAISIMTVSITGAGLVIAFYALVARMSEKIFENRFTQLDELRENIKQIKDRSDSFEEENFSEMSKSFQLSLINDEETINISGNAIFSFKRNEKDQKWRIVRWKDESDL